MNRVTLLAVLLTAFLGVSGMQAQARLGMHGGYGFEFDNALIGGQLRFPISRSVDLYPSFDYHLGDGNQVMSYNADMMLRTASDAFYMGGGLNITDPSEGDSDTGFSLFGGWESRGYGTTRPYFEIRGIFSGDAALQLALGLNFILN